MNAAIAAARLQNQRITDPVSGGPAAVVSSLGAVQAQEFEAAKWALALRMRDGTTEAAVERAFADGRILRTHVLRPTWHFVPRADIRWMLQLTGPRVQRALASYHRRLGLEPPLLRRAVKVIERALGQHGPLTRQELRGHLARAGITLDSMRLAFTMMRRRGDGRHLQRAAPQSAVHIRPARRSRAGCPHAPPRRSARDARPPLLRQSWPGDRPRFRLVVRSHDRGRKARPRDRPRAADGDRRIHLLDRRPRRSRRSSRNAATHLLPIYDEYLVAYRDRIAVPHAASPPASRVTFQHALVIDGQVAGTWRTARNGDGLAMTITPLRTLTVRERRAARDAALQIPAIPRDGHLDRLRPDQTMYAAVSVRRTCASSSRPEIGRPAEARFRVRCRRTADR